MSHCVKLVDKNWHWEDRGMDVRVWGLEGVWWVGGQRNGCTCVGLAEVWRVCGWEDRGMDVRVWGLPGLGGGVVSRGDKAGVLFYQSLNNWIDLSLDERYLHLPTFLPSFPPSLSPLSSSLLSLPPFSPSSPSLPLLSPSLLSLPPSPLLPASPHLPACMPLVQSLLEQGDFLVVGALGSQGVGKSTIMSLLAGTRTGSGK